jgi:hypothetical protein
MESRSNLRRDEGEPDRQTGTENNQQGTSYLAISTMAAGPASADYGLNFPYFRVIQQN